MSTSKTLVFFGTEDFSAISLKALIEAGFSIAAVVTKPNSARGRGHKISSPLVKTVAQQYDIPVWQPAKLTDISADIAKLNQPTGVLVSYGKIIPQSIIDLFAPGIINVHPSLLPKYRGPSPIESSILHGDTETGVSIMQLSAKMDTGPVYIQEKYPLDGTETAAELYQKLGQLGAALLIKVLPRIISKEIAPKDQAEENATYCQLIQKSDGVINWNNSTEVIERELRAYNIWPKSRTTLGEVEFIVKEAHSAAPTIEKPSGSIEIIDGSELRINTGNGSLSIDTIQPIGKKEMPIQAFLAGYRSQLP